MRKIYLTFFALTLLVFQGLAQSDTLLWEDFEAETIDYIVIDFPTGDPNLYPTWLNFDVDGVGDGSGSDRPGEWFLSYGFADVDSANTVLASSSWLEGTVDGADNWLISPRIHIQDNLAMLHWKSAPYQLPRYMDGYQVLISTTDNVETSFTDTVAVFAEFDGHETTNIEDTATYVFTDGIMHTEMETDSADFTRNRGVLQQWQASLEAYEGQDIFIAFRHRSDDDNLISIDDILVTGTGHVGINEATTGVDKVCLYPNPATTADQVLLSYTLAQTASVSYEIFSEDGKMVVNSSGHTQLAGVHRTNVDVSRLSSGNYFVSLLVNDKRHMEQLIIVH